MDHIVAHIGILSRCSEDVHLTHLIRAERGIGAPHGLQSHESYGPATAATTTTAPGQSDDHTTDDPRGTARNE